MITVKYTFMRDPWTQEEIATGALKIHPDRVGTARRTTQYLTDRGIKWKYANLYTFTIDYASPAHRTLTELIIGSIARPSTCFITVEVIS